MSQEMPVPPPTEPAVWRCIVRGQQLGPMTRDELVLTLLHAQDPGAMVWRPGMAEWAPAGAVPELAIAGGSPPSKRQRRIVKNARQNAIAMFVVFVLGTLATMGGIVTAISKAGAGPGSAPVFLGCLAWFSPAAALFAAIYLPIRWKVVNSLSPGYRYLGLIGGFGLIAQAIIVLMIVAINALAA